MTSIKNNELFEIADILKKNGFETSSLHSNYDIKHLYSTNDLRNNLNIPHKLSDVMDCSNIDLDELSLMAFEVAVNKKNVEVVG